MAARTLGLDSASALVVGEVIGVGIFLAPAEMTKALGSPFWLLVIWIAVGVMALSGSLCYGELAARYPEAGGGYAYLREAWGPGVAFLYGWMSLLVMDPGLTAALAAGLARYAAVLVPLSGTGQKAVAIVAILHLALINVIGVRLGAGVVRSLTAIKLVLLGTIIAWGFGSGRGDWSNFQPFFAQRAGSAPLMAGLAAGFMGAFFSVAGFWDVAKIGGEVREPAKTLPRALALGVSAVILIYILTSGAFIYLVPIETMQPGPEFASQAGVALFGAAGGRVLAGIILVTIWGSLAAVLMTAPRVYYAMARDGLFFRQVGQLHPRFGTPVVGILLQALLACIAVAVASFESIIAYFIFATVSFLVLTVAGLYRLPRPSGETFRVPGYPFTPLLFLALLGTLLVLLAGGRTFESALGTAVVALGYPVYRFVVKPRAHKI